MAPLNGKSEDEKTPRTAATAREAVDEARFAFGTLIAALTRVQMALPVGRRGHPTKATREAHQLLQDVLLPLRQTAHTLTNAVGTIEAEELRAVGPMSRGPASRPAQMPLPLSRNGAGLHA